MSFWDSSWESVDPNRIAEYIGTFDMGEDNLIATMHQYGVNSVCDAGCGCGIYATKLAANGFSVSGFDVSAHAVEIAQDSVRKAGFSADFKTASILNTGYENNRFDCVLSRDVLDHISKADAIVALKELCRITKPGGIVLFTLDSLDEEYEAETHIVNADGDYVFTAGKWNGMVFHPYSQEEVYNIIPTGTMCEIMNNNGELTVLLMKENILDGRKIVNMHIQFETGDVNHEIAEYIFRRQNEPGSFCHLCPQNRDGIVKELERLFAKPDPRVFVIRNDVGTLEGVFNLFIIPEERYIETDWGFVNAPSVYDDLISHLHDTYPGYHLDAVVTKSNQAMFEAYRKNGLVYQEEQILMDLKEYTPKSVNAEIVRYSPVYEASYRAIHDDEGLYWTAERMLKALDEHYVFIAIENGEAVGYIEMTACDDENVPIQLLVKPECRGKGYGRALMQTAIENNFPRKMVLDVDADNTVSLNLYLSLGFQERLREYLGSMTV